ncbi:hypothetical protein RI129_013177 [Pyrocoelia pectoralis]|uniref:beta-glucosidase n=1 Tax=Pyrocoelia pectoralis TaxID=417401 RepID=A0AAN7ZCU8_9COLE
MYSLFLILTTFLISPTLSSKIRKIPDDLMIGCATSAYQVEGAWNEDGKGENIWDRMTHSQPERVVDGSNADIACDSYHKIDEDVALIKNVGFQHYRFSISWPRILPYGFPIVINKKGIQYYNKLIDKLIDNGITPVVTIYHFDLPQILQDLGGWTNSLVSKWFEDYARVIFDAFGDRVKLWITINEPYTICEMGYGNGTYAPGIPSSGVGDYLCARNILLAHARVYHLYKNEFVTSQKGRIGLTIQCAWKEPGSNSSIDKNAAYRDSQFEWGLYTHPIYSKRGDFPEAVKKAVKLRSLAEGFAESRLPTLSSEEVAFIRGTYDFFGLNHYFTQYVINAQPSPIGLPSYDKDVSVVRYIDPNWTKGSKIFYMNVPWGLRKILKYIKQNYGDPEVFILENGVATVEQFNNYDAIKFYYDQLNALLDAVEIDKVKVKLYTMWSLMDNFEFVGGYTYKFGLYHVDFEDPNRNRTPKLSFHFFKDLLKSRVLQLDDRYVEH